jgi:hypothetical protein
MKEISPLTQDAIKSLKARGFKLSARQKKVLVRNRDYEAIAYVVRHKNWPDIKIMPDMISPHRPYPIYIYIFAVAIYELVSGMTQRRAAEITRQCFGLETFSAPTLCRARKKLEGDIAAIAAAVLSSPEAEADGAGQAAPPVIEALEGEYTAAAPSTEIQVSNTRRAPPDTGIPSLVEILRTIPGLMEFVKKNASGGRRTLPGDKAGYAASVGRVCRKYFLLYRRLII